MLTATELAARIRADELSPVAAVESCLVRIEQVDPAVRAWVHVDRAGALAAARALEAEARAGTFRGPLHGVPVGLKDIFDVAGMVTTSGAAAFAHRRPEANSAAAARLRAAGAIILGKTTTTEFAFADPTVTRNPWNVEHTPGGSSSGSAAAVAARMIPLALGSQTIGSTLRPAAYCGIVGLKATHGLISAAGVTPLAWSLDHIGIFARSVDDTALLLAVLADHPDAAQPSGAAPRSGEPQAASPASHPPRLGIPREVFATIATAEVVAHLDAAAAQFARAGAAVENVTLPPSAKAIHDAGQIVLRAEAATYHRAQFAVHAASYRPRIRALVEAGLGLLAVAYVQAQHERARFKDDLTPVFERFDALLMPVAPAPAPRDLTITGDPILCAPWSFGGFPAIALPSGVTPEGLPLAIQVIAGAGYEARLLDVALWCEAALGFRASPPV